MSAIPHVFHTSARPIRVNEFVDALHAVCRPRFPPPADLNIKNRAIPVALAISGGVDSMALAFLCAEARRRHIGSALQLADNPVDRFFGIVVDHGFREGSAEEANAVVRMVGTRIRIRAELGSIRWRRLVGVRSNAEALARIRHLPNFETIARQERYKLLARRMVCRRAVSLLLGHHEDDQYETVLMRLANYHGPRGLMGIPASGEIPYAQSMHGAVGSGLIDDQMRQKPIYCTKPNHDERRRIQSSLRAEMVFDPDTLERELRDGFSGDYDPLGVSSLDLTSHRGHPTKAYRGPPPSQLPPCPVEDGGVMMYRPLLEFSKERLIATCLENDIPWFEDATNRDPTLTSRNAIRHLVQHHRLPAVLQKPAVLDLSMRCRKKYQAQQAEAARLLGRSDLSDFHPNVGSIVIKLPGVARPQPRRRGSVYAARWCKNRLEHSRTVAGLLVQRLLQIVSPLAVVTPLDSIQDWLPRLFPGLADPTRTPATLGPPKSFVLNEVHFIPLVQEGEGGGIETLRWRLARAPHMSGERQPYPALVYDLNLLFDELHWWSPLSHLSLDSCEHVSYRAYDGGRFWVKLMHRLPNRVLVGPLDIERLKGFRDGLRDDTERKRLDALLRRYAPGKVRWTLPAIYTVGPVDWALPEDEDLDEYIPEETEAEIFEHIWREENTGINLVALPTLGVHLPGIERWILWSFRFRRIGRDVQNAIERSELDRLRRAVSSLKSQGRSREVRRDHPIRARRSRQSNANTGIPRPGMASVSSSSTVEEMGARQYACAS